MRDTLRPSPGTLAWVERALGRDAKVVRWRRLTGGITSSIHQLAVSRGGQDRCVQVVLRRWLTKSPETAAWAVVAVEQERLALERLAGTSVPAPEAIAATDGSDAGGVPSVLMTRAPGRMHLRPDRPKEWIGQIARVLPKIHNLGIEAPPWERWTDPDELEVPRWATRPDTWKAAIAAVGRDGSAERTFIHRDFQHFNLLWSRGRLTSVVDWVNASQGPPDIDVGHCRLNLAVLFSAEWADDFRGAYEAEAGRKVDPLWDILALLSYDEEWKRFIPLQVGNRAPIDLAGMNGRVEAALASAVARL